MANWRRDNEEKRGRTDGMGAPRAGEEGHALLGSSDAILRHKWLLKPKIPVCQEILIFTDLYVLIRQVA